MREGEREKERDGAEGIERENNETEGESVRE